EGGHAGPQRPSRHESANAHRSRRAEQATEEQSQPLHRSPLPARWCTLPDRTGVRETALTQSGGHNKGGTSRPSVTQAPPVERKPGETAYLPISADSVRGSRWVRWALVLGLLAFASIFLFADFRELWQVLAHANLWLLSLPILCMLASYLAMARSYQGIAIAAGCPVSLSEMLRITFVANSMNYLVA